MADTSVPDGQDRRIERANSRGPDAPVLKVEPKVLENPYVNYSLHPKSQIPLASKIRLALGAVILLPIRMVLLLLLLVCWSIVARLAAWGVNTSARKRPDRPLEGWRCWLLWMSQVVVRPVLFCFGYPSIRIVGKIAPANIAPLIVIAPHQTPIDFLVMLATTWSSFVSLPHNYPVVREGLIALQCILVDQSVKDSRKQTMGEMRRRAESGGLWPQVMVFPEGTTHASGCLTRFKPGAFVAGQPVQPVILSYKADGFDPCWCTDSLVTILGLCMSQWWGEVTVEFLPPYFPTPEELVNAELYADNVRCEMARQAGLHLTNHAVEDMILQTAAIKRGFSYDVGVVKYYEIFKKYGIRIERAKQLLLEFLAFADKKTGLGNLQDLAKVGQAQIPPVSTPYTVEQFLPFDDDKDGCVNFRQFLEGVLSNSPPSAAATSNGIAAAKS